MIFSDVRSTSCAGAALRARIMLQGGVVMSFFVRIGLVLLGWTALIGGAAAAQGKRQNTPGEFDYYVLSLSWSPSFCEDAQERGNNGRSQQAQCGGRPFSFVVHG